MTILSFSVKDCNPSNGPPCSNPKSVSAQIFASPDECCGTDGFKYLDLDTCVVNSLTGGRRKLLSGKWYYLFEHNGVRHECVRECDGPEANCAGKASDYKFIYNSFRDCCEHNLYLKNDDHKAFDCTAYDENGNIRKLRGRKEKRLQRMDIGKP
jgi:hypothetical protein